MKRGRVKGGSIIPATIDTGRRFRSNMAQPIRNMAGSPRGTQGGAAQNIIEITSDDLVQNGGQYKLMGGTPLPMQIVTGRRSQQGPATVVYPVDANGDYDPSFTGFGYANKVLATQLGNLIGYWPLWEASGTVAESLVFSPARDGTYNTDVSGWPPGVGIGDGRTAPIFDGDDVVDIFSLGLQGAFDGDEGTMNVWSIVANAGIWADGLLRRQVILRRDANNRVQIEKAVGVNQTAYVHRGSGVLISGVTGGAPVVWTMSSFTWSLSSNRLRKYSNGVLSGGDVAGQAAFLGLLSATETVIGAGSTGVGNPYLGRLAHAAVWDTELTGPELLNLATV